MGRGSRIGRIAVAASVALVGVAVAAPAANADFHLMKIREVFLGQGVPNSSFIELQMYAQGQTAVTGHTVAFYQADGTLASNFPIPGPVANGESQRTILIGDDAVPGRDFTYPMMWNAINIYGPGGAACFDNIDCVSWGGFTGSVTPLVSPAGNPAPAIPAGSSLERSIAPNCATLLEDSDDTNVSLNDFALQAAPNPRNNATPPTETACSGGNPGGGPDTKIDKGPKKKTKKKKATFEFSSTTAGTTFECRVDGKTFAPCTSPFEVKVKKGKHEFEVRAVLAGVSDGSPAKQDWKVKKPKK